jgi:hypothetical protein
MNNTIKILIGFIVLLLLLGFLYIGYTIYPRINKPPQIKADTILIYDTVWMDLPVDTILIPSDTINHIDTLYHPIDTIAILADYLKEYKYDWIKQDSNIIINGSSTIFKNRLQSNSLRYKWLKPVQIIHNSTITNTYYNNSLSFGLDIPFKEPKLTEIESILTLKQGYIGAGFTPYNQSFSIKFGISAYHFRGRGVSK